MKKLSLLFAALLAVSTMFADVLSWNASAQGYENAQVIDTVTFGNPVITMTFNKGTNNNAPKYYTTGAAVRCYGGNYFTVDAGANTMTAIDLTFASGEGTNAITTNAGEYADGAWTGSATNVTFTIGGTSGHRRIATISVTLAAAGGDTTVVPVDTTSQDTTPVIVPVTMENLTFNAGVWNQDNAKFGAWVWGENLDAQFTDFFVPGNDSNLYLAQVPETADSIVFVRFADTVTVPAWGNGIVWNQTMNYAVNHADMYFTITDWTTGTWGTPVLITSLADAKLLAVGTEITTTGIVTYINGKNAYMQDATDGILLYGTSNFTNFQVGDEIVIDAKVASYGNAPELSNVVLRNIVSSENTVNPILMTLAERVANPLQNFGMMITINELTITAYDSYRNPTLSDGTNTAVGYKMSLDTTAFPIGSVVDVTAIAALYNGNLQFQGDPAGVVLHEYEQVHYYIKNNWDGAAATDWTWKEMTPVMNNVIYEYTGVFGGSGVNINTVAEDNGSTWFPVADFRTIDSTYVPQALDTIHFVYSIVDSVIAVELVGRPEPAPVQYFIKNNWNGGDWAWVEMNTVIDNVLYDYTGVFGGRGVNINTAATDEGATWFSVADFRTIDSTYVPQALDTIHFVYSIVDSVIAVELIGRPAPAPLTYYIKNNWNGGDWAWVEMNTVIDSVLYDYTGVFGGSGVNINTMASDTGSTWFPVADFRTIDSTYVPQALDTIHFVYSIVDSVIAVELVGRPAPAPEVFQIKNNWNGGEWTWVEMTPVVGEENVYQYTGIFGGKGVNITSNYMNGELWFPVDSFLLNEGDLVPQYKDTVLFAYNSVENEVAAMVLGRHIFNTCAEVNAISAKTDMELGEVTVVFAKGSYIYVEDATATTLVYTNKYGNLKAGDRVWGIAGEAKLFSGLPELAANTAFDKLVVTEGTSPAIKDATAAPTMEDINKVMMFRNVAMPTAAFAEGSASNINGIFNGDTVTFRNNWKEAYAFDSTKTYTMLGCVAIYNGNIQVYVTNFEEYAPVQYYIKNNWNGAADWSWAEMNTVIDGVVYEYTGVFGGTGVNINTAADDEGAIWFPVEKFSLLDSTFVPQAFDTLHFVYSIVDAALAVELVGRPVIEEIQYYIKNNWNGGEWTWEEMTPANDGNITWIYQGIFGGTGVNINTVASDADALWFPVDQWILTTLGYEPAAGDEILFEYDSEESTLTATFKGQDGLETITFEREGETVKVIMNGQLYIVRDGKVYNALGAQVR